MRVLAQSKVKNIQHPLLHLGLQVDQHIAAADQVNPAKRRVGKQVLQAKHHRGTQRLGDREMLPVVGLDEIALELGRRQVCGDAQRVTAHPAHF